MKDSRLCTTQKIRDKFYEESGAGSMIPMAVNPNRAVADE
jgi:hypothetical protein